MRHHSEDVVATGYCMRGKLFERCFIFTYVANIHQLHDGKLKSLLSMCDMFGCDLKAVIDTSCHFVCRIIVFLSRRCVSASLKKIHINTDTYLHIEWRGERREEADTGDTCGDATCEQGVLVPGRH